MQIPFFSKKKTKTLEEQIAELGEVSRLKKENQKLKRQLAEVEKETIVDVGYGDPDREEREDRKEYVSKVAGIHNVLVPKFKSVSSRIRDMMSNPSHYGLEDDEKTLRMLQGADWTVWEIIRWANKMKSEMMSYHQKDNN